MTIYSLYIYDRHCACIYYHDWHRLKKPKPANEGVLLPNVTKGDVSNPRNTLNTTSGVVVASGETQLPSAGPSATAGNALPFDEEAKLVYGVLLSLRNMVKKLSGREETFVCYRTSNYKMQLFETITGYKFVMLTDPSAANDLVRNGLRQIYIGPFLDHVVRNPLITMDSRESGIDNDLFRAGVDRIVRHVTIFS
ncbi:TRAPP subunit bet5 [Tulasnella sp. 403]|nr:TRAPP subunit bet5 [Tulasnella sp. 403]